MVFGAEQFGTTQGDLARRSGVKLPSMAPILVPLVVYGVLVSLGLFVLLKLLRRMAFAWVAIPVLALVTAVGIVIAGHGWRSVGRPAASAFVDGYPGGAVAQVSMLTFSRDGGTTRVALPSGWHGDGDPTGFFAGESGLVPRVRSSATGTELSVRLDAGQVTTATASGPSAEVGLTASARVDGDSIVGTVTNSAPYPLEAVAVFGTGGVDVVGDLAPGGSAEFTLPARPLPAGFGLGNEAWRFDGPDEVRRELPESGIWGAASVSTVLYPTGMVRVAGWTEARPADGDGLSTRSVVTSLAAVAPGDGPLPAAAVRTITPRSPFGMFGNGLGDAVHRFTVPPEAAAQRMVVELPLGLEAVEVWTGTTWVTITAVKRVAAVPPAAVRDGVVLVKVANDINGAFFGPDQKPVLRGATPEDPR
jgi:hypothetical protein